jgi:hypothetical protein
MKRWIMNHWRIILLVLGFILVLFGAVFMFTRQTIFDSWGLSTTGQIGDTIGGIAGPIINIVGSLLIYLSFISQNKANQIQGDQNSFVLLHDLYKDLKDDFNNLTFYSETVGNGNEYRGKRALSVFCQVLEARKEKEEFKKNSYFNELLFLTGNFSILLDIVTASTINVTEKQYVLRLIHFLYQTKIKEHVTKIIQTTEGIEIHNGFHSTLKSFDEKMESSYVMEFEKK